MSKIDPRPSFNFCDSGVLEKKEAYNPDFHNYGENPWERCNKFYPDKYPIPPTRFLIIDPQVAFHPGGHLAVKGANEDSERIIAMLKKYSSAPVYVSLDSHTIKHIGHYDFWKKLDSGEKLPSDLQGNPIMNEDTNKLFIQPQGKEKVYIQAKKKELKKYAIEYVKNLWDNKDAINLGKVPMLWPTHCVIGDKATGRAIYPPLFEALKKKKNVEYYKKGENELAEMYSIFKSELQPKKISGYHKKLIESSTNSTGELNIDQIEEIQDGKKEEEEAYLNTEFNDKRGSLYSELIKDATPTNQVDIYICGEALSHCVNYSLRDLVEKLQNDRIKHVKVHLVLNCSSTVVLETGPKFFGNSVRLIDDILEKYKDYCDIVFWKDAELKKDENIVKNTRQIFYYMEKGYDEQLYSKYLDNKLEIMPVEGGKRTKKKRHSKTQKKRKGQIKKSKRHSRSRK